MGNIANEITDNSIDNIYASNNGETKVDDDGVAKLFHCVRCLRCVMF